jgi:hypothetical protein
MSLATGGHDIEDRAGPLSRKSVYPMKVTIALEKNRTTPKKGYQKRK